MKKTTKLLSLVLAAVIAITVLVSCGGGGNADSRYVGKYIAVAGEALGMVMVGDDIDGFDIELSSNGKAKFTVDGEVGSGKWTSDDTNITLTIEGEEIVGTIGTDTIIFEDMFGMGMDITFAKEGTAAADPELYRPEAEKKLIGTWASYAVADILGDDMSGEIPANALNVEFKKDNTATVILDGEEIGTYDWSMYEDWGAFGGDASSNWEFDGDELLFTYAENDAYYIFTCSKQ